MPSLNIRDFGALGDGRTNDAHAFQQAIDRCSAEGGGRVVVPAGALYLTGSFELKSHVDLYIERGATIKASSNPADYTVKRCMALIYAEGAYNSAILGGGTIDGSGKGFIDTNAPAHPYIYRMKQPRPFTLMLAGCTHLTIRDIVLRDGAHWTLSLAGCEDVLIDGIRILNDLKLPNNDGIDLDHCRNVRVSHCHIESGDDCVSLKACERTNEFGTCENIIVSNCTLISTSCALVVGCEARSPIRNVIFEHCVIHSSHRGLGIHLSEGSDFENILFSNMVVETRLFHEDWWGRAEPIYITAIPWTAAHQIGHVRHVRFSHILCRSENGIFIQGWDKNLIQDIVLEDVRVELGKWSRWPGGRHDLRPCPGEAGLREHPTAGFFMKNAQDVTLRNCTVAWCKPSPEHFHYALEVHNVDQFTLDNFRGDSAHPERYPSIFRN